MNANLQNPGAVVATIGAIVFLVSVAVLLFEALLDSKIARDAVASFRRS